MNSINLVIPMKPPGESKQRLKGTLASGQRYELAMALYEQTLSFFKKHFCHLPILVVTSSDLVANLAKQYGAKVLLEANSDGLNNALEKATLWSLEQGFKSQLIIPADIANLKVREVAHLLSCDTGYPSVAIAIAKDKGTNALLCTPPDEIPFCFGYESSKAHQLQALSRSLDCHLLHLPFLGQDVDLPHDLAYLKAPLRALSRSHSFKKMSTGESHVNLNG
jgi:2-phospho-L-lactate guanylyltransferase